MASRPEFNIFDRNPDAALDELAALAAVLSDADYAYIGWMDFGRLWFKARFGFNAREQTYATTACRWMLQTSAPLLILDAGQDQRFPPGGIPLAGARPCNSYAGVPLIDSDERLIGSLAVLAQLPNRFSKELLTLLETLARQVVTRLELYTWTKAQEQAQRAQLRTEHELAVERCFVAATLDSIPALVAVLDTAGRMVRMNYAWAQVTGVSPVDAVGRPFVDEILEAGDRAWATDRLREAAAGQVSGPHETDWRIAAERTRRVSWTLRPLKGPNDEIQYLIVSGQDVTEQRHAELALLSREARYREMVENSLGFVFTCSMQGRLTSLNAFTADTLGYRAEALMGRAVADLLDEAGRLTFAECLRSLESREQWQGALPLRRSDGIYRRIALRSHRMELPGEQPFVLNHGIDITEQYEAEQALHIATRQRELILESVGDGIFGVDLAGSLTFINHAGARMLGYAPEELIGRDILTVLRHSPADGTPYTRANNPILQALHRSETVRMRDDIFSRQDGVAFQMEYTASPLIEDGHVSGMVVAFQDVSERLRLEHMKNEFISTVSHELRTPLTSLRASLGLISSGSLDKRPEKQKQMVEVAIDNCDRLIRLVNDILDFDRVEKGKMPLQIEPVEAVELLRRAADVAHGPATQAEITFRIDAPPARVLADEERLLQVLNELVTNAIKFSPPNTQIKLGAVPSGSDAVCFYVEDQGRGIAPEKLEQIFERFQQGDASDSRALGGTGLGLALCRSIVERHGGRIWVQSTPGKGSRFQFTVPLARQ